MNDQVHEPELQPWFWELLESSGRSLRILCRHLEALPKEKLLDYYRQYDEARSYINPAYREECWPNLKEECSEDCGDDFAAWAVSQGQEYYEQVHRYPELIDQYWEMFEESESGRSLTERRWNIEVDRDEFYGYQRADYIAIPVFEARFGEDLFDALETWRSEGHRGSVS